MIFKKQVFHALIPALVLLIAGQPIECAAQQKLHTKNNSFSLQTGFSIKASVELGFNNKKTKPGEPFKIGFTEDPKPIIRISTNAGVGSSFATDWLYPTFNLEVDLYNGGLGSSSTKNVFKSFKDLDIVAALSVTAGTKNKLVTSQQAALLQRNIPLYYFSDMVYPALQNPFSFSSTIGTNIIFTPVNKKKKNQRVGFFNLHFNRVQVSYFNDGGAPMSDLYLGDREDKNYTGGVTFSYHGPTQNAISLVEITYQKFTGYTKNAFEISNHMLLNFMTYHKREQSRYNKSLISLSAGNPTRGWQGKISSYNSVKYDLQHAIHWGLYNTFHMVPYKPAIAISGGYFLGDTKLGLR